jgi:hypothetical protein
MIDLQKEFFKRDLTDAEEQRLADQLAASPKVSLRFARLAENAYLRTGLPDPRKQGPQGPGQDGPGPKGPRPKGQGPNGHGPGVSMTLKVVGGLLAGGALVVMAVKFRTAAPEIKPGDLAPTPAFSSTPLPERVPLKPRSLAPVSPVHPPADLAPLSKPGMVQPLAYDPAKKYEGLDLIVERATSGLVTVRVLDNASKEVRLLYAGFLGRGKWNFTWDGKLDSGELAHPGLYRVEVQSGKDVLTKEITISSDSVADQKK